MSKTTKLKAAKIHKVKERVQAVDAAFTIAGDRVAMAYASFGTHKFRNKVLAWNVAQWKEDHAFLGCSDVVDGVAFSPDGKLLACVGSTTAEFMGGEIHLLDTATWKTLWRHEGERGTCHRQVAISPDGKTLATGSALSGKGEERLSLWDIKQKKLIRAFGTIEGDVKSMQFSPDGKWLAIGCYGDRSVSVWSTAKYTKKWGKRAHTEGNLRIAYSPDGKLIASAADTNVALWKESDGKRLAMLKAHDRNVTAIAFSPDGVLLCSAAGSTICLWHVASRKLVAEFEATERLNLKAISLAADYGSLAAVHTVNDELWIMRFELPAIELPDADSKQPVKAKASAAETMPKEERELIQAVADNLDDNAPKQAYAQWLTERNDPLGKFIDLSLKLTSSRRAAWIKQRDQLLDEHFEELTKRISAVKPRRGQTEFERGFIKVLRLRDIDIDDDAIACLQHCPALETLDLEGTAVTDAGMKHLKKITNLTVLILDDAPVSKGALKQLASLNRLVDIRKHDWGNRQIPEMEAFKRSRNNRFLKLPAAEQRAEAIRALEHLASYMRPDKRGNYPSISYSQSWASDADLVYLQAFPEVTQLDLFECSAITSQGLKHLRALPELKELRLTRTGVTDLAPLKHLTSLESLELDDLPHLYRDSFKHLAALKNLRQLTVRFNDFDDEILTHIACCESLEELDLIYNEFTEEGKQLLQKLPNLKKLEID